jgi:hypothetical protein
VPSGYPNITWTPLLRRHDAAMGIVKRIPIHERWQLLLAVVAPSDERLIEFPLPGDPLPDEPDPED